MREFFLWLLFIVGGFLSGSVMFSALLPRRLLGRDVPAESDDKNPGAGNVFTHCGVPMGMLCLFMDMAKGFVPVFLAARFTDTENVLFSLVIAAPVLGHALAPLYHFHGGKCIATAFGALLGLLPHSKVVFLLAGLYIFFSVFLKIRPHRRRSILVFALFGTAALVHFLWVGSPSYAIGCTFIALIAVLRHTPRFCVAEVQTAFENEERSL